MALRSAALSDRGRVRPGNEDAFLTAPEHGLFAVADGMGGHAGGEVASHLAIAALEQAVREARTGQPREDVLRAAVEGAHRAVLARAATEPALQGMGTTLTAAQLNGADVVIGHVGDSRAYLLRGSRLERLTVDHTVVQGYVDLGEISAAQARTHRFRHILTRALGTEEDPQVDVSRARLRAGDLLLLCSDGLTGMVDDPDLEAILAQPLALDELARQLVSAANLRGGDDNVTVVLVAVD